MTAPKTWQAVEEILLVAVTKTRSIEEIKEAASLGLTSVGENRVQELVEKRELWPGSGALEWRLIGHLQRNKARKALAAAAAIDSLDSPQLASTLSRIAAEEGKTVPVLLEVNTSGEASKNGIDPCKAEGLLDWVLENCPSLRPEGFMTIGPLGGGEGEVRRSFALLRSVCEAARALHGPPARTVHGHERRLSVGDWRRKHHGAHRIFYFGPRGQRGGGYNA